MHQPQAIGKTVRGSKANFQTLICQLGPRPQPKSSQFRLTTLLCSSWASQKNPCSPSCSSTSPLRSLFSSCTEPVLGAGPKSRPMQDARCQPPWGPGTTTEGQGLGRRVQVTYLSSPSDLEADTFFAGADPALLLSIMGLQASCITL